MTLSLRGRLLLGIISAMVILLLIFSMLLYSSIRETMMRQFDASLLTTARMLTAAVEIEHQDESDNEEIAEEEEIKFEVEVQMLPDFNQVSSSGFYQLHLQNGQIIARSPSLGTDKQLEIEEISERPKYHTIKLPGNKRGRSVSIWFVPEENKTSAEFQSAKKEGQLLGLTVARDAAELYKKLISLRLLLAGVSAAVILLSIGIGSFVVKTGLKPLNHLAERIAAVNINTLGNPLDLQNLPAEMTPVVQKLNDLLERLKLSFEREQCFTSDVAHELRTPLAGIRATLEVALSRPRNVQEYRESLTDCLDITGKMQQLVDKLLVLARLEVRQITLTQDTFSIAELIEHCYKPYAESADKRGISFRNQISHDLFCTTDKEYLAMALSNLLENAINYTNTGGRIWTESRELEGQIEIRISNTGSTLTEEQVGRVFDRFWRADTARTDTGFHCGLGLSLVGKIIQYLNGKIHITSSQGIFSAVVVLNRHSY